MPKLQGVIGKSGDREVLQGFATAQSLSEVSFADVLEEGTGTGYQRRFSRSHSLDFRKYIQRPGSTTIPLTFNARPDFVQHWRLKKFKNGNAHLAFDLSEGPILTQVDCQHRLGCLADSEVSLPFMCFLGLALREEMQIFNVINGKAKGLNASLLDYHQTQLLEDVSKERPELYLALRLNKESDSPWFKRLDLGGKPTVGMTRKASLRTMQKGVSHFLKASSALDEDRVDEVYVFLQNFWNVVVLALPVEWGNPRKHFLTKGIGVYALMRLAADIFHEPSVARDRSDGDVLLGILSDYVQDFDWTNAGPFRGLGGESGATQAYEILCARRYDQLQLFA